VGFDRDAAFTFEVHAVKDLFLHLVYAKRTGGFEQSVRKSRFPVVNMRDYREITYVLLRDHSLETLGRGAELNRGITAGPCIDADACDTFAKVASAMM
jgi:hypothetical protein